MARGIALRRSLLWPIDDVLRGGTSAIARESSLNVWRMGGILLACGSFHGAILGSFIGHGSPRLAQIIYSAAKIPLLLLVTSALTLPSFFVVNNLLGLRADFIASLRALAASQAALTITLASLAPVTLLWYLSDPDYSDAILFNAGSFVIATAAAQFALRREYRPLIQQNARHRLMLRVWLAVYAFVGIQMGWVLRPFIGDPDMPVSFFRPNAFTNAYLFLMHLILGKL